MTRAINSTVSSFFRAEVVLTGAFSYDEANAEGQEAYSLVNLRAGARVKRYFADVWLRNAFDTRYVPVAIPYPGFAPSGFIGENGRPRTFGVTVGTTF
jgi:iron complex outermembrane receptor protein